MLTALKVRRGHAVGVGFLAAAGAALLFMCVLILAHGKGLSQATVFGLVPMIICAAPIIGYVVYTRSVTAPGLVVWMPSSRAGQPDRLRLHRAIGAACFGMASPVTIHDPSSGTPLVSRSVRMWIVVALVVVLWALGGLLIGLAGEIDPGSVAPGVVVLGLLAWTGLFWWRAIERFRGIGFLRRRWNTAKTARRLEAIGRGKKPAWMGVEVLRVARTGEQWKLVIDQALERADVAIIDVSDVTSHTTWQIGQALGRLHPDRVLLVAEAGSVEAGDLHTRLAGAGPSAVKRSWIDGALVVYPGTAGGPAGGTRPVALATQLRGAVAGRLVNAAGITETARLS